MLVLFSVHSYIPTVATATNAKCSSTHIACLLLPKTLRGRGWGTAVSLPAKNTTLQEKWGPAPLVMEQSEEGGTLIWEGVWTTFSPCSVEKRWPLFVLVWRSPLISYLQLLESKSILFWTEKKKRFLLSKYNDN